MLPITITLTPTMITFKDLTDELANELDNKYGIEWSAKGYYFYKGNEKELYKVLLHLSYTYDIEII